MEVDVTVNKVLHDDVPFYKAELIASMKEFIKELEKNKSETIKAAFMFYDHRAKEFEIVWS